MARNTLKQLDQATITKYFNDTMNQNLILVDLLGTAADYEARVLELLAIETPSKSDWLAAQRLHDVVSEQIPYDVRLAHNVA